MYIQNIDMNGINRELHEQDRQWDCIIDITILIQIQMNFITDLVELYSKRVDLVSHFILNFIDLTFFKHFSLFFVCLFIFFNFNGR